MTGDSRVLFCNSPYGRGGIGQHFAQLVEETRAEGFLHSYVAPGILEGDDRGVVLPQRTFGLERYTPLRWFQSTWKHVSNVLYDVRSSFVLPPATRLMGFAGKSLYSFRQARRLGYDTLELVAANSHVDNVRRMHDRAASVTGISDSWLSDAQVRQTRKEYDLADVIYVHSQYVYDSFLDAGSPEAKIRRMVLRIHDGFHPPSVRPETADFHIVYVGRLDATKGIPLLLDAFDRISVPNKRLTLVGGWTSPALAKAVRTAVDANPRIVVAPGDPVPALHRADVFVHPTFEDGYAYAPAEALACGVPVIVTEDTGMKEYVRDGQNGFVIPTGSVDAIVHALRACYDAPMARTVSLLPPEAALSSELTTVT